YITKEFQILSSPLLVLPMLDCKGFQVTMKRRQRAKIKIILALCQQSDSVQTGHYFFSL
ncbi:hypothetical protein BA1_16161, partial [Bacillus xiamenensis]